MIDSTTLNHARQLDQLIQGPLKKNLMQISSGERQHEGSAIHKNEMLKQALEENQAIKEGLEKANDVAISSDRALQEIDRLLNEAQGIAVSASSVSVVPEARQAFQSQMANIQKSIDRIAQDNPMAQVSDLSALGLEQEVTAVSSAELGLVDVDLTSTSGATEAQDAVSDAQSTLGQQRVALGGLVTQLQSQLASLDDAIVSGARALSTFTDADLIMETSTRSQLDTSIHTSILVQQEALQQNRWVGRVLDQLN
jgi:flagellin-like hook-associated protein FlgL